MFDSSKIKHWKPGNLSSEDLLDGKIYHKSLYLDDSALNPRKWHKEATEPLINLAINWVKNGDIIVDYGSGTGGSAVELVRKLDDRNLDYKLILVDPLESWFSKAYDLLKNRDNVFFCKSYGKNSKGNFSFFKLDKLLGSNKVDIILSSSTIHLIPAKSLQPLFEEFNESLSDNGKFIWSSGDIPSGEMPSHCNLLHDPYREILKLIKDNDEYQNFEEDFSHDKVIEMREKADKIFPYSNDIKYYLEALSNSNLEGELHTKIVTKDIEECKLFMKTPRLSEIAALITNIEERNIFVEKLLTSLTDNSQQSPDLGLFANGYTYSSYWHYGVFGKVQ